MRRWILFITLAFLLISFGCKLKPDPAPKIQKTGKQGGTLVVAMGSDIDNFNPVLSTLSAAQDIHNLLYIDLLEYDENFKLHNSEYKPCLTKSWQFSEDFLEVTLLLRDDVNWSDGKPITSYDIEFTYQKMIDPDIPYSNRSSLDFIEECTVKNEREITFRFKEVYANELSDVNITPLPKHVFGDVDADGFINHPFKDKPTVISGPYQLKRWDRQQTVELEVNPNYSFYRPNLDRIVFRVIPDVTSRVTNLKIGEVDLVQQLLPEPVINYIKENKLYL